MADRGNVAKTALGLVCAIVAVAASVWPQAIGRDEVRISSGPYVPQSSGALRASTEIVEVGVVPRDARGRAVEGLKQEDFEVYDDGKPQPIKAFAIATRQDAVAMRANASAKPTEETQAEQPAGTASTATPHRAIALFFDDIHTSGGDLGRAKIAAKRFLTYGLSPGDRIALFTSSATATVDYTEDSSKILAAMGGLQAHLRVPENGLMPCPRITPYQAYLIVNNLDPNAMQAAMEEAGQCNGPPDVYTGGSGSVLSNYGVPTSNQAGGGGAAMGTQEVVRAQAEQTWEMTRQASQVTLGAIEGILDSLAKQPGTRMLVLTSSGFLAGAMNEERDAVVARALRSGTVIDALDAKGLYTEAPGPPLGVPPNSFSQQTMEALIFGSQSLGAKLVEMDAPMADFAESTGGLLFHNNNDLDLGFREIGMVPEVTYLLGISPARDGKYHQLRVKVAANRSEFLQARPGYFAPSSEAAQASSPQQEFDKTVVSSGTLSEIPATVAEQEGPLKDGSPALWVSVHVDVAHVKFGMQSHRHTQELVFVSALLNEKGDFVVGKESRMDLMLKDASLAELSKTGITAKTFLQAPPGRYSLREVVRDGDGKLFASSSPVEIR
ncbi:MAG TPA: VWA domain-containing protein [Candidatus Limnocylindrales bacterium]|nr:VWA domain-containing protein [Candidatus Limnocylindrales bacterium]